MTPEEIKALAERIAALLDEQGWVPAPVRPEPPSGPHAGDLPAWAGSAQPLSDVAPGRRNALPDTRHRPAYPSLVSAARGAAAGRSPSPTVGGAPGETGLRRVPVAVSNRHIHVDQAALDVLFGAGHRLRSERAITQPGQFAAEEKLTVEGPAGRIENVRVVGPVRPSTQVELALSDCRKLGLSAPVQGSGNLTGAAPVKLIGPAGQVELEAGAIVAARHLHLSEDDGTRFRLRDGQRVDLMLGSGERTATIAGVLVRCGPSHATELHVDADEANAFNIEPDSEAVILGLSRTPSPASSAPRRLITERDVASVAREGKTLSDASPFIVTPSARDRARALGIWRES